MSSNQKIHEKVRRLKKQVDDSQLISTFAQLVSWETDNEHTMNRPRIAKPLLKQLQSAGLYLDLK